MQKLIWLLALPFAMAQVSDLPGTIDRLNKKVKDMKGPEHCETCEFSSGQDAPPLASKLCLKEMCGDRLAANLKKTNRILQSPYIENGEFTLLAPMIKAIFRQSVEIQAGVLRKALEWKKRGKPATDAQARRLAMFGRTLRSERYLQFNDRGELDAEKSYDSLMSSGSSSDDAQTVIESAKVNHSPMEASSGTLERQLRSELVLIDGLAKRFASTLGVGPEWIVPAALRTRDWEQVLADGRFGPDDASALRQSVAYLKRLQYFMENENIGHYADRQGGPWAASVSTESLAGDLKEMENFLAGKPAPANPRLNLTTQLERHVYQCFAHIALRSAERPSLAEAKRFIKIEEPMLRKKFLKKVRGFLSSATFVAIEKELQKVTAQPPEAKEEFLRRTQNALKRLSEANAQTLAQINKSTMEQQDRLASFYLSTAPNALAESLTDLCSETGDIQADYRNLITDKPRLDFSAAAVTGGTETDYVVHHTYGHFVSRFLEADAGTSRASHEWYDSVKNCLAQGHGDQNEERVSEDFADLIAMSLSGAGGGYYCAKMVDQESSITVRGWHSEDTRLSGHFFRILHHRILTGAGIPENCRVSLMENGEAPFERNCLKETPEAAHR